MHYMSPEHVPQFTNPWVSQDHLNDAANLHALSKTPTIRTTGVSSPFLTSRTDMRHLTSQPTSHYSNPTGLMPGVSSVGLPAFTSAEMAMSMAGSTAPSPTTSAGTFMPSFSASFDLSSRSQASDRRLSQPAMHSSSLFLSADSMPKPRQASLTDISYRPRHTGDLDFTSNSMDTRGILMSQPSRPRHDSIYQSSHSANSSVSSTHSFPYYGGSVDSSATDYSDGSGYPQERAGTMRSSRPNSYLNTGATVPNQMMTTFSSKITSSTQKKHKCKVCDKRFTRPSSLQTHTYSHTGEKPFACEQDGCGRRFSVVSNLRRHKKVHQGKRNGD
ncbi:hypothetical protein BZA05DRAFT_129357 [Tricharina praecox]|uniref:uncharacterized protein n=1 Tax=Tricharina praecox TaxID=43433 RepID=UPI0022212A5D|nr:uncharacterized protein BZA05DRAFT_129357 [Tricharina praecox]KAI5846880.1 hypothetical protein BZA05DRAFT_129357 [Tricharina praecox]